MGFLRRQPAPPSDPPALVEWMASEFTQGQYGRVWEHRLRLGLEFSQDGVADRDWFWLNAFPTLSALRAETNPAGRHPLVSTCAGFADQVYRSLDEPEREANDEIHRRFFGG